MASFSELQRTQPVSIEKLPLPDGAAREFTQLAVQSAPGTSANTAVTVQGSSGGVALPVTVSGPVAVTGTFFPDVQPISAVALPLPAGAATSAKQPALDGDGGALAHVTNFPATQPVSGTVGISGTVPVSGTFWQATQPVSGSVSISNFPATQPVSLATNTPDVTDRSGRLLGHVTVDNASIAVTGTFWQTTQPVSLASVPAVPQGAAAANTAGWPVTSGQQADTTGTFTNATQTNSVTATSLLGYETVTVSISGTYGTASGVFEVSDDGGTTWYAAQAARSDSATVDNGYTGLTNTNRLWMLPVNGADQFRVRSTTVASGTVNVRISPSANATADSAIVSVANTVAAQGDVPAATTDSGNPQKIGGLAKTANPTAVADGQRVNALYDKLGKLVVIHSMRELRGVQQTTIGVNTETTIVTAGAAGVFNDLYALIIANTSATAVSVTLKDATGGTTRGIFQIPAGATTICFQLDASDGIPQAVAANNWTLTSSAAVASLQVTALYVKNL